MTSPLHHIRLELAREPGKPAGDPQSGYDLVAPLDADGRLDPTAMRDLGEPCRVRRFESNDTVATGQLKHVGRDGWVLDFPGDAEDQTGFRFGEERFVLGEYVSVRAPDGDQHTFRVAQLRTL
ncbi:MAG: hypothetical protein QME55_11940 [Brevundimonas sp.]|uniref:hypothetical protein n=1 Tax=Brevundimonas sp. TaxID=1871086 RepID=UPI0026041798|nr:hypothetical protein [Brevundimonas sp.]MDI6625433.1 hypothetical protein [Brevundimonas sp.]MDQ7813110.1 hypothetical protein [Brevundimonas sp.]